MLLQLLQFNEVLTEHTTQIGAFKQINLTFLSEVSFKVESIKVPSLSC